jgi:hypothetical protein
MEKPKFKINGSYESPENINFDILGLHKELIIASSGFLTDIKYWKNYDGITYSDLYVHEKREFVVDDNTGLAITRKMTISWYLTDNTIGYTRVYPLKYYDKVQSIQEGIVRRNNVIDKAKVYCIDTLGLAYGFDLQDSLKNEIYIFSQGNTQPLRTAVQNSTKPYLTQEIKDAIIAILTYN